MEFVFGRAPGLPSSLSATNLSLLPPANPGPRQRMSSRSSCNSPPLSPENPSGGFFGAAPPPPAPSARGVAGTSWCILVLLAAITLIVIGATGGVLVERLTRGSSARNFGWGSPLPKRANATTLLSQIASASPPSVGFASSGGGDSHGRAEPVVVRTLLVRAVSDGKPLECGEHYGSRHGATVNCARAPLGAPFISRSPADVARRARLGAACLAQHPRTRTGASAESFVADRAVLAAHGAALSRALFALDDALRLSPANHTGTTGYAGPWVENFWRGTFARPLHVDVPLTEALARIDAARVAGVPDGATPMRVRECTALGCAECAFDEDAVRALTRGGLAQAAAYCSRGAGEGEGKEGVAVLSRTASIAFPYDVELFQPFVPIFAPWEDANTADVQDRTGTGRALRTVLETLRAHMRHDVLYITVMQRPAGSYFEAYEADFASLFANMMIISSGGSGHVAIPLLARQLPLLDVYRPRPAAVPPPPGEGAASEVDDGVTAKLRTMVRVLGPLAAAATETATLTAAIRFVGTCHDGTRAKSFRVMQDTFGRSRFSFVNPSSKDPLLWVTLMAEGLLAHAPRGTGPTSFRLYEALQMGVPPVYVFDGTRPWLPYLHPLDHVSLMRRPLADAVIYSDDLPQFDVGQTSVWEKVGIVAHIADAHQVALLPEAGGAQFSTQQAHDSWWGRRVAIERARERYFTYTGVLGRIMDFLEDPFAEDTELFCVPPADVKLDLNSEEYNEAKYQPQKVSCDGFGPNSDKSVII